VQDTNTATEPGNNPAPLVGDPNDRVDIAPAFGTTGNPPIELKQLDDAPTGSGVDSTESKTTEPGDWPMRRELALILTQIGFERDRQIEMYSPGQDDSLTEFDWATRRQTYELRLARDVSEPAFDTTKDSLIKLAAICVAQLEALERSRKRIAVGIEGSETATFRDVVQQRADRDGFRVTREFVRSDLPSISIFVRTRDLPVTRSELAQMREESWRKVVRDAAAPSLDKLTEREVFERDHLSMPKREAD
jgi:hypothetical protein